MLETAHKHDFVTLVSPTEKRRLGLRGDLQEYLTEGAVMLAFAFHLKAKFGATHIEIRPDGEHGKRYSFSDTLAAHGFQLTKPVGKTSYGGLYRHLDGSSLLVELKPGKFDVVAKTSKGLICAETKGGILNTSHPGPTSRLRRGLCEAVGLLMSKSIQPDSRHMAVVPDTRVIRQLTEQLAPRLALAGIGISVVDRFGCVEQLV